MPISYTLDKPTNNTTAKIKRNKTSPSPPYGKRKIGVPVPDHNVGSRKTQRVSGGKAPYHITQYTYRQAKKYGVKVKQSTKKDKKIDVFKKGEQVASVGARGMNDFPTFAKKYGWPYAKTRRRLYRMRHEKDRHIKGTKGWYADKLLWG